MSLVFKFEHPIWISHIFLGTQIGQQKTKGIEIFINEDLDTRIARSISNDPLRSEIKFQNFAYPGNKFNFNDDQNKVIFLEILKLLKVIQIDLMGYTRYAVQLCMS